MSITYTRNPKFYPHIITENITIQHLFTSVDKVLYTAVDKYSLNFED